MPDGTALATVAQLWRYPVKSMQGEQCERLDLDTTGAVGDRRWGVVDVAAGKVLSAKRHPALLQAAASYDDATGDVTVTLPGGDTVGAADPGVHRVLSDWLGREVRLERPPADSGVPFEMHVDPVDDTSAITEWSGPPSIFVDLAGVHLLSDASLAAASALYEGGEWDIRRFRPTAFLHAPGDGYVEDGWIGGRVLLGEVDIEVFMPTPRSAMPTRAQPGLRTDADISRTLSRHHASNLGVYGAIRSGGAVAVGDEVHHQPASPLA